VRPFLATGFRLPCLLALLAIATPVGAQQIRTLEGVVRNETGRPLERVQVVLDPRAGRRETRTDADGRFEFLGVSTGPHELRVMRIGFQPDSQQVNLGPESQPIEIVLRRVAALQRVDVIVTPTGVYGTVLERDSLRPIPNARVTLMGAREADTSDAQGAFAMPSARPGTFMMRVSAEGYDTRIVSVRVPKDSGVGIDLVLKPGSPALDRHMEMLWADMAQRIHWRGVNSAVVGRQQLLGKGRALDVAIRFAPDFATKSIKLTGTACLFVDGVPRPMATVSDFDTEDVESIEVYASGSEISKTLGVRWPRGAMCGRPESGPRGAFGTGRGATRENVAQFVSIWLRR
jgi:hypothetical protein